MKIIGIVIRIVIAIIIIILSTIVMGKNKDNVTSGFDDFICILAIVTSILFIIISFLK